MPASVGVVTGSPSGAATVLMLTDTGTAPAYLAEVARSGRYRPLGRVELSAAVAPGAIRERAPDIVLVDIGTLEGVRTLAEVAAASTSTRFLVVSALAPEVVFFASVSAGARGFVQKPAPPGILDHAMAAVAAGWTYVDPRATGWLVELVLHSHLARDRQGLSLRQVQVLLLVRSGLTNKQIGVALGVSAETVKCHLQEAMRKLGARDRWEAAQSFDGEPGAGS